MLFFSPGPGEFAVTTVTTQPTVLMGRCAIFQRYHKRISMAAISLKLPEDLLEASGRCAEALRLTRAEYMRRALEEMNRETRAALRARRLGAASRKVRGESMKVNAEFAAIERDVDA